MAFGTEYIGVAGAVLQTAFSLMCAFPQEIPQETEGGEERRRTSRRRTSLRWQAGATEEMMLELDRSLVTSQLPSQAS